MKRILLSIVAALAFTSANAQNKVDVMIGASNQKASAECSTSCTNFQLEDDSGADFFFLMNYYPVRAVFGVVDFGAGLAIDSNDQFAIASLRIPAGPWTTTIGYGSGNQDQSASNVEQTSGGPVRSTGGDGASGNVLLASISYNVGGDLTVGATYMESKADHTYRYHDKTPGGLAFVSDTEVKHKQIALTVRVPF